jgi:beta-glucanase (GH16 family)
VRFKIQSKALFFSGPAAVLGTFLVCLTALSLSAKLSSAQEWGQPVWSDEFDAQLAGTPPDAGKWTFEVGGSGWGNHELEIYCAAGEAVRSNTVTNPGVCDAQHPNAFQDGHGHLIIRAMRVSSDPAPVGTWTSARMKTAGLAEFQYGRMEACIRLPVGAGLWPAFWMLGTRDKWPAGGEIDIMENVPATGGSGEGLGPTKVEATIHGPNSVAKGKFSLTEILSLPNAQRVDDSACHIYGAIISPFMIQMYVDDWKNPFYIRTAADVPREGRWVYNAPFFFLLNLAVGGDWPGPPDAQTPSPSEMLVDYVRVYRAALGSAPKIVISTPLKLEANGTGTTYMEVQASPKSGYVFLGCTTDQQNVTCEVDTYSRNKSVLDPRMANALFAKITINAPRKSKPQITVDAYAANGAESHTTLPVR